MSADESMPHSPDDSASSSTGSSSRGADVRAARRAQREAERAARAQRKADAARERAMEAARAGGLFEGVSAMPRVEPTAEADGLESHTADAGPAEDAEPAAGDVDTGRPTREPLGPERRKKLTVALAAASVLLLIGTGFATWGYVGAREAVASEQSTGNAPHAATDAAREIATQMFTYDHRTVDADLAAVRERLTDPALAEFVEQSMPAVASSAKQQEASVYATVAAAAPQEVVDSEHVAVLVMLNRMVSTKEAPEAASSASRLSLEMERVDGTWKLSKLNSL